MTLREGSVKKGDFLSRPMLSRPAPVFFPCVRVWSPR